MTGISLTQGASRGAWLIALSAITILLSACTTAATLPMTTVSALNQDMASGYRIWPGDSLRVKVFDQATLTNDYKIGVGGDLAMPVIKAIDTNGMTPEALAKVIAQRLEEGGYVTAPRVSVELLAHGPFYILGEVKSPGEYAYRGVLTLDQAIALAGGFTPRANKRSIVLLRQHWPRAARVRLDEVALKIAPGDTITVHKSVF